MKKPLETDNRHLQAKYDAALALLKQNTVEVLPGQSPVLIEGGMYKGIWLECGPLEGLAYASSDSATAIANHRIFFNNQREDGYLPCYIFIRDGEIGDGQIQMVVPIAATALELGQWLQDETFLEQAYSSCVRWDAWLARFRNTRGKGLCEAFCEYDTGHDNSPRWKGMPRQCPEKDARKCGNTPSLPYLAPDLSATVYGGRVALAKLARLLGKGKESAEWEEKAASTRRAIMKYCFDDTDACFYDLNADGKFVRIRGDALTRVLSEHVVDQALFEEIYSRHIRNPEEFWAPFPLPSIALNDPVFDHALPLNSWGGASQALTALRAPRWFEHYGKPADLGHLMRQWIKALIAGPGFMQQLNPWTGECNCSEGYSPAALVLLDFVSRLHGIRWVGETLEWNCQMPEATSSCSYELSTPLGTAHLHQDIHGATLMLSGRELARVVGTARVITSTEGRIMSSVGIAMRPSRVAITCGYRTPYGFEIAPNATEVLPKTDPGEK